MRIRPIDISMAVWSLCLGVVLMLVAWSQTGTLPDLQTSLQFSVWTGIQNEKVWTQYVKQSATDNSVVGTVLAQVAFGNRAYKVAPSQWNVFGLFQQSESLISVDVVDLMQASQNPEQILTAHINQAETVLANIFDVNSSLSEQAQGYITQSQECFNQKQQGDAAFFQWVQRWDATQTEQGLQTSLEFAPCYITNRIRANAAAYLAQKVMVNAWLLAQRVRILNENSSLLVNNYAFLESDILERLLRLKQQLLTINALQFDQFQAINEPAARIWSIQTPQFNSLPGFNTLPDWWIFLFGPKTWPTFQDSSFTLE